MGQNNDSLKLNKLEGQWFVVRSNFPMWVKGNKINPSFNYIVTTKRGKEVLLDEVVYAKQTKSKNIVGYDKPVDENNRSFVWRGKGILFFLKSRWDIVYLDKDGKWMIIHFRKTLFTPEGYDVISRSKKMDAQTEKQVLLKLTKLKIEELTVIHQD